MRFSFITLIFTLFNFSVCEYGGSGSVGSGSHGEESCRTIVEAVPSVVEETSFETQCATVSDRQCKTEIQTSYTTQLETQCRPGYTTKCKPVYKTAYKKFCTTVEDTECRTTVQTTHQTAYDQQCSTVYSEACHDNVYGKKKCSSVPKQQCKQVVKHIPPH